MHLEQQAGVGADGLGIIVKAGAIGGTDFAQGGIAGLEDFRDAKAAANLDQFATRNDDLLFGGGKLAQDEHERGGAIIYDRGRLGDAKFGEALFDVRSAFAAAAGGEVDFEVCVAGIGRRSDGGAAKIGMDDHASAVDDRLQSGQSETVESLPNGLGDSLSIRHFPGFTQGGEFGADGGNNQGAGQWAIIHRLQQRIDAGNGAQFFVLLLGHQFTVMRGSMRPVSWPNDFRFSSLVAS